MAISTTGTTPLFLLLVPTVSMTHNAGMLPVEAMLQNCTSTIREVYGLGTNTNTGQQTGLELGYIYDSMDISIKDSTLNPVATITSGMAYASTWSSHDYVSEWLRMENVTVSHYKGYTPLNNAIQNTDICVRLTGSDGSYIKDSTFNNCGTSIYMTRSPYAYGHNAMNMVLTTLPSKEMNSLTVERLVTFGLAQMRT